MIDGVCVKKLKVIPDERGRLMEILRADDECFQKFGQVYMTTVRPGIIKAWHYHKKQTDNFACVRGLVKVALYDNRKDSKTHKEINEFFMGEHNPVLIKIPPNVYHGFKGASDEESIIINIPTEMYNRENPDEFRTAPDSGEIPYDWARKDG